MSIFESDVEAEMLGWFEGLGYEVVARTDRSRSARAIATSCSKGGCARRCTASTPRCQPQPLKTP